MFGKHLFGPLPALTDDVGQPLRPTLSRTAAGLGIGITGGALFAWAGAPLAWMLGALITVTAVSLAGGRLAIPSPLRTVMVAVLCVRFAGVKLRRVWPHLLVGAGSALIMMAMSWLAAILFAERVGVDPMGLMLALVPGGLVEMGLIALSLGIDTAMVSTLHVLRIAAIMLAAPLAFVLLDRYTLRRWPRQR